MTLYICPTHHNKLRGSYLLFLAAKYERLIMFQEQRRELNVYIKKQKRYFTNPNLRINRFYSFNWNRLETKHPAFKQHNLKVHTCLLMEGSARISEAVRKLQLEILLLQVALQFQAMLKDQRGHLSHRKQTVNIRQFAMSVYKFKRCLNSPKICSLFPYFIISW